MEDDKALSKSVSLLPKLWDKVEAKAAGEYGDNRSNYIRTLLEADLAANKKTNGANSLVALAERYHPTIAGQIEALCFEADRVTPRLSQAMLLTRILESALHILVIQKATETSLVREEAPFQAQKRRLREIEQMLEVPTDHRVIEELLRRSEGPSRTKSPAKKTSGK